MFARYKAGAMTDLQGLQAFDTNGNNLLDAGDALFNRFGVWQDANSDGVSQAGEFTSLAARGIATISLTSTNSGYDYNGAYVAGLTSYTTTGGATRIAADVSLRLSGQDAPRSLTGVLDGYGLDLDGNGVATVSKDQSGMIFDTDNDGFMEKTAWLNRNDGLLVVDWNGDGKIESASEVVTANNTVTANQGTNRIALLDGNADQLLNGSDTAFANGLIKVWRDANGNGQTDATELKTLAELGITQINVANGTYTSSGVAHTLTSLHLTGDALGTAISDTPFGIRVRGEDGASTSYIKYDDGLLETIETGADSGHTEFFAETSVNLAPDHDDLTLLGSGNISGAGMIEDITASTSNL